MWDCDFEIDCYGCGTTIPPTEIAFDSEAGEEYPVDYPAKCPECGEPVDLGGPAPYTGQDERRQLGMSWF
jgi:hypothetical protein